MNINVFEGARRIAVLMGGLWAAGCIAFAVFANPSYHANYVILWPGSPPRPTSADCSRDDAVRFPDAMTASGQSLRVKLCFAAHKADDGRVLVPYEATGPNSVKMNDSYSPAVSQYADAVRDAFQLPTEGLAEALALKRSAYIEQWTNAGMFLFGGLAIWWALVAATGWIARGFLGVPRGADRRPSP